MTFFPTEEQRMLRDVAHTFAQREVMPIADQIDRDEHAPESLTRRIAELGLYGLCIAPEYGGIGSGVTEACLVLEEIAKASPAVAGLLSVQMVLCPLTVASLGTAEQKRHLLPASASGEWLMAYAQTESAGAGYIAAHTTRLDRDGDGYRLNGAKLFCTQGEARTYLVMCRTQDEQGAPGYACVVVDRDAAGFHRDPYEDKFGWRGTNTGGLSFDDVAIAPDAILGSLSGMKVGQERAGQSSFLCHAATSLGAAAGMFDKTFAQVRERTLHGQTLARLSPISTWLAEIYVSIRAMRSMVYSTARLIDEGRDEFPLLGSACKTYVCETAYQCTDRMLQMWGGSGMMNRTGINRYMRDARLNNIAEGSTQSHQNGIFEWLMSRVSVE